MKRKKGFSLIELVVVFGVIGLLTSFSVAFYNNFKAKEAVGSVVSAFYSNLRLARERAILSQKPNGGCSTLNYWLVDITSNTLKVGYNCDSGENYDFGETFEIPDDVTVAMDKVVNFVPLTGTNSAGVVTITISSKSRVYEKEIEVEESGVINEN